MGIVNALLFGVYLKFIFFTQGKINSFSLVKPRKLKKEECLPHTHSGDSGLKETHTEVDQRSLDKFVILW